ncbi:hypothetical protein GGI04_001314 [Coemansia thaxteri]|nr:hypothetical protein GGI04_001314 [Coemansia thaxteri]KAJ2470232.1 hypothetical protein GGI02_003059 [Coemansia sp. RSA 2322]
MYPTVPFLLAALCAAASAQAGAILGVAEDAAKDMVPAAVNRDQVRTIQVSRANANTNMPEFIDIGPLLAAAAAAASVDRPPRPTVRVEDVGPIANQPKWSPSSANQMPGSGNPSQHVAGRGPPPQPQGAAAHVQALAPGGKDATSNDRADQREMGVPVSIGKHSTRTVVSNRIKTATVFDDDSDGQGSHINSNRGSRAIATAPGPKDKANGQSSSRQPGQLNRFGDDESAAGASLAQLASGIWKTGTLTVLTAGYFWL